MTEFFETTIDISKYIDLYNEGISIKKIKPMSNQTYSILVSSNLDIRVIDREKVYPTLIELSKIKHFIKDTKNYSSRYFYMIPIQTPKGTIVGFILRTVFGKSYATVYKAFDNKDLKVPYMFGFYKDFDNIDTFKSSMPIVICEGLKDCMVIKSFYPYALSNNTSSLGLNANILRNITNKFILAYDNDTTGYESTSSDKASLKSMGCFVDSVQIEDGYKDCADLYENKEAFNRFKNSLLKKINYLRMN